MAGTSQRLLGSLLDANAGGALSMVSAAVAGTSAFLAADLLPYPDKDTPQARGVVPFQHRVDASTRQALGT